MAAMGKADGVGSRGRLGRMLAAAAAGGLTLAVVLVAAGTWRSAGQAGSGPSDTTMGASTKPRQAEQQAQVPHAAAPVTTRGGMGELYAEQQAPLAPTGPVAASSARAREVVTVYLVDGPAFADSLAADTVAARLEEARVAAGPGAMITEEVVLVAGDPEALALANAALRQLRLDHGDDRIRLVDLRRLSGVRD